MLLNLVESLYQENLSLKKQIQNLQNEINRLKGEQGKPPIKPGKNNSQSQNYSSEKERKETKQRKKIARLTGSKSTIRKNVMLIKLYFLLTHNLRAMKKLLFKISDLKPSTLSSLKKSTTHLLRIKPGLPLYHPAMRENSASRLRALSASFILILTSPNPKSLIFFMMQKLSFLPARSQSS